MLSLLAPLVALTLTGPVQQPVRTIQGIVRVVGDSGAMVAGASVQIGKRTATSDAAGSFHIDSVPFGDQPVVIRRIGYQVFRASIEVHATSRSVWEFFLPESPYRLADEVVEARRTGIYGIVTDRSLKPLAGVTVEAIGNRGGTQVTDSAGRFAFPEAIVGAYMVRTRHDNYAERRLMFTVERGKGVELSIGLAPGDGPKLSNADAAALFDLRRSLAFGLKRERMVGDEVARYGSLSVCDVPRVRAALGTRQVAVLNGERVTLPGEICSWNMDEIAMIQFISGPTKRTAQGPLKGAVSVVIWEKW